MMMSSLAIMSLAMVPTVNLLLAHPLLGATRSASFAVIFALYKINMVIYLT